MDQASQSDELSESNPEGLYEARWLRRNLRRAVRRIIGRVMHLGPAGQILGRPLRAFENWLTFPETAAQFMVRDPEEDRRMQLPAGEDVQLVAIWLAEIYTPTTLPGLLDRIDGYLRPVRHRVKVDELKANIAERRKVGGAAFSQLPWAVGKDEKSWFRGQHRLDDLPKGIRYVAMSVHSLNRSITVLVSQFVLTDDQAAEYSRLATASYSNRVRRTRFGFEMHYADTVKAQALGEYKAGLQVAAERWLAERFPGYFANLNERKAYPSMDLTTTRVILPWNQDLDQSHRRSLGPLGLIDYSGYWNSSEIGARLNLERPSAGRRNAISMAARLDQLLAATGREDLWSELQHLRLRLDGLVSQWAAVALLREIERDIAALRDLTQSTKASSARALRKLRAKLIQVGLDSQIVAKDIAEGVEDRHGWGLLFTDFEWVQHGGSQNKESLGELLRTEQLRIADYVSPAENNLRGLLATSAELTVAAQNIRLQKAVMLLTIVSTAVAVAALIVAVQAGG